MLGTISGWWRCWAPFPGGGLPTSRILPPTLPDPTTRLGEPPRLYAPHPPPLRGPIVTCIPLLSDSDSNGINLQLPFRTPGWIQCTLWGVSAVLTVPLGAGGWTGGGADLRGAACWLSLKADGKTAPVAAPAL